MATVPGQLIWEIVKKNNSFLVKEFGRSHAGVRFSKEPNNLLNLHSYKQSGTLAIVNPKSHFIFCSFALKIWFLIERLFQLGLANKKTVTIQPGKDQSVLLATTKTRKQNKPAALLHKSVLKKDFRRMANAVNDQVNKFTGFHLFMG